MFECFRRLHSTVTSLLHVTDRWLMNIDKGLVTGVVFIDLQKAVDTVDINILQTSIIWYHKNGTQMV